MNQQFRLSSVFQVWKNVTHLCLRGGSAPVIHLVHHFNFCYSLKQMFTWIQFLCRFKMCCPSTCLWHSAVQLKLHFYHYLHVNIMTMSTNTTDTFTKEVHLHFHLSFQLHCKQYCFYNNLTSSHSGLYLRNLQITQINKYETALQVNRSR